MLNRNERYARVVSSDGWVVVLLVASDCLKSAMKYVEAIVRMRQRVVGWKTGVAARLRAEVEVGSVIGRAWMVET
jgi:hypothetical protein